MHIVVIGGGVIGTTTAYWLALDGHKVTLLERSHELAAEGSFANGGMLHASHGEPWNSPQAVRQFLAWIGREDSPLLLRPGRLPQLLGWGLGFLRNSTPARHRQATLANTRLARYSLSLMAAIRADLGLDYDHAAAGIAKIFWNTKEFNAAIRDSDVLQELGLVYRRWSTEQLIAREPALAPCAHRLAGALHYPSDETGDTCLFTRQLGQHCRQLGVQILTDTTVRRLVRQGRRVTAVVTDHDTLAADHVVLANGTQAQLLARSLQLRLPLEPVKGYSITIDGSGLTGLPRLALIDDQHKIVATPLGTRLRVAGTAEFAGHDTTIRPRRIQLLLSQLSLLLPQQAAGLTAAPRSEWACLRAMTPDGVPIVGASGIDNLWLNVGAGHMGWTLAAAMGRLLADALAGRTSDLATNDYRLDRPSL